MVHLVISLSDVVLPGAGIMVSALMRLVSALCERLLRKQHKAIERVKFRMNKLLCDVSAMEARKRYTTTSWAEEYQDVLMRFHTFMTKCENRNALVRCFQGSKASKKVAAFHDEITKLETSVRFEKPSRCAIM